jgi:hypothetical protein
VDVEEGAVLPSVKWCRTKPGENAIEACRRLNS